MRIVLLALSLLLSLTACTTALQTPVKTKNVLLFDKHGRPLDPSKVRGRDFAFFDGPGYSAHVDAILDEMEQHPLKEGKRHVVIFIHGGLNTPVGTVNRATKQSQMILDSGVYPLFLNWASPLTTSYSDHLFRVSQGKYYRKSRAIFFLNKMRVDLARALLRWPEIYWDTIAAFMRGTRGQGRDACQPRMGYGEYLADTASDAKVVFVEKGCDCMTRRELWKDKALHFLTSPISYGVAQPVVDTGGSGSWNVLLRRTDVLFHRERLSGEEVQYYDANITTLAFFLEEMVKRMEKTGGMEQWSISIIGHSMGALVANHLIRDYGDVTRILHPDDPKAASRTLPLDNIVYMAAACSVADYEASIIPFLRLRKNAKMYHLTLHPQRELRDNYLGITPRGTLLVWIDRFLAHPAGPQDLTAGRYENIAAPLQKETPSDVRERVFLKVFRAGRALKGIDPQQHGGFDKIPDYWLDTTWKPMSDEKACP